MPRLAAVSIGSNTVHALLADEHEGQLEEAWRRALLPGLAAEVERTGRIGAAKRRQALGQLRELVREAREAGAERIVCGATAAVRRAADGPEFIAAAERAIGLPVRLVSGTREAQLSFLGAASAHAAKGQWLLADLGGGSTELVVAEGARRLSQVSLELGSGALAARHLSDPPSGEERARVRRDAIIALRAGPECEPRRLVVTGGTSSTLPRILSSERPPEVLTRAALLELADRLDAEPAETIAGRFEIPPERLLSMRAGIEILLLLLDWCGLDLLHVSHQGIRHGMLIAHLRLGDDWWREET